MRIPWMSRESIAAQAGGVVENFQKTLGCPVHPPIPVEDIVERHLGLRLCYEDLEERLGIPDVLGATYVGSRKIVINERLFEDRSEGRLVFTAAHEVGHWVLHRRYAAEARRLQGPAESIVCRSRDAREPIEWQADAFAASLLMPAKAVRRAFKRVCGEKPLVLQNVRAALGAGTRYVEPCAEHWPLLAEAVCAEGGFSNVSKQAMIIRLQELGLLVNLSGAALSWSLQAANA